MSLEPMLEIYLRDIASTLKTLHDKVDKLAETKVDKETCAGCELRFVNRQYLLGGGIVFTVLNGIIAFVAGWLGMLDQIASRGGN